MCSKTIPEIRFDMKNIMLLFSSLLVFLILGIYVNSIVGFFVYYIYILIATVLLDKNDLIYLLNVIKETILKQKNKYFRKEV